MSMKALVLEEYNKLVYKDVPKPQLASDVSANPKLSPKESLLPL